MFASRKIFAAALYASAVIPKLKGKICNMKTKSYLLLISLFSYFLGCTSSQVDSNKVIINGKISSLNGNLIKINDHSSKIDISGKFRFELTVENPGFYILTYNNFNQKLFLTPGINLRVEIDDSKNDKEIKFLGNGAPENNYLAGKSSFYKNVIKYSYKDLFSMDKKRFINTLDSCYMLERKELKSYKIRNNEFLNLENAHLLYSWLRDRTRYPFEHYFFTGKEIQISNEYLNYTQNVNFNDTLLYKDIEKYKLFIEDYLELKTQLSTENNNNIIDYISTKCLIKYKLATNIFDKNKIKDEVLNSILFGSLGRCNKKVAGELINRFNHDCTSQKFIRNINDYYKKWESLSSGVSAPEFILKDSNNNDISLHNFKGQYIYVDVWNTYCAPCYKEFPLFNKLKDKFKNRNIAFISISFDKDVDIWKKTMRNNKLSGIQLFAGGWNSDFAKKYLVYENPRFILIDKESKIIYANAPRPSERVDLILNKILKMNNI